ncbi:hypothetical protein C2G38_2188941 [Gigaspora rosea]|uniref:Uncharacterized protein n=1 Tax=Gigaspora rosea TaxID=44941 RepID=A0A397VBY3_9GLOM|nr:hypothetical protein C2G38_2188941 [Gigaspora rosea]
MDQGKGDHKAHKAWLTNPSEQTDWELRNYQGIAYKDEGYTVKAVADVIYNIRGIKNSDVGPAPLSISGLDGI